MCVRLLRRHHSGGVGSRSPSCAKYTIVNIRWKRTQRDFSGNLLKTAKIKGLYQFYSVNLPQVMAAFHKLHFSSVAASSQERLDFFIDSPEPRLSSSSTTSFPSIVSS